MQSFRHVLGKVVVPGEFDNLDPLYELYDKAKWWAADTETTGTYPYAADFKVRLVQVGTKNEAWVLRPEWHLDAIEELTCDREVWWHNAPFDAVSMEAGLGISAAVTMDSARDSSILSRLLDPRDPSKGGIGHRLKDLAEDMLQLPVKDERKELVAVARKLGIKAADMWREIPIDTPEYVLYAGQDVLLTARIAEILSVKIKQRKLERFVVFEHDLARKGVMMRLIGTRVD